MSAAAAAVTHTLIVRHVKDTADPPRFTVSLMTGPKLTTASDEAAIAPPNSVRVAGRPNDDLTPQLRWYLEDFLDCPFDLDVEYAERVQAALREWGKQAFNALFSSGKARDYYSSAIKKGMDHLTIQVVSDSPFVLGWPWEALEDASATRLAHQCAIERRTQEQRDPTEPGDLPTDCVNVLLVIARPLEDDVPYRCVSRLLVDLAADHTFPVSVHVLRPPTLDGLRAHLAAHPNHYHILHFDGHGGYGAGAPLPGKTKFGAPEGRLLFETADGRAHPVETVTLNELLREHAVPAVVLNACQSATIDEHATNPFASVAATLLKAGTRSVVAMAYSLYVSGAKQFLPAFYGTLFKTGRVSAAVRAGRQQMLAKRNRVCPRGEFPIDDWLVPVVYQQDSPDFEFVAGQSASGPVASRLPEEARDDRNPYGFVGRDAALLALERAMHLKPAAVVISGLGGVGKTTLAKGFLRWLDQTGGLSGGALWFDFRNIRSAEYVLNRIGEALTGDANFATLGVPEKLKFLAETCRKKPMRIVWDNFESARGIAGTGVAGNLSDDDAKLLQELLARLRGGQTKVLITSRSPEEWLGVTNVGRLVPLGGLDGEERWTFANAVLEDLGLTQNPHKPDPDVKALVDLLRGHPLAMRVMLPKLANQSAAQLVAAIRANLAAVVGTGDEATAALTAMLRFATESLPAEWQSVLIALGLHEEYAQAPLLELMAKQVEGGPSRSTLDACLTALGTAGLVRDLGRGIVVELHPLLTSHLRAAVESFPPAVRDGWTLAFVDVMAGLADALGPRELHEKRGTFSLHEGNFHAARSAAERLGIDTDYAALTQSLGFFALNTHNYPTAVALYDQLQAHFGRTGNEKGRAVAYHQLGSVAEGRRDFDAAEGWYRKALAIAERLGDEHGAAITYNQLGNVAQYRRDFEAAERWYRKATEVFEWLKDEYHAAIAYHQLGVVAQERRDFDAAEGWCRKSLAIAERLGDEHGAAQTYHQLGNVAEERRDWDAAEGWYRKSLAIKERLGNEHGAAQTHHQLGSVADERMDLDAAETWYRKAVEVFERLKIDHHAAGTYHNLGMVAEERRDWAAAEGWYRKSLVIAERLGDEHGAAGTYHNLGRVAVERRNWDAAWAWFLQSLPVFTRLKDEHNGGIVSQSLARSFGLAPVEVRPRLLALGRKAGLPDEDLHAIESAANSPATGS